MRQSAEDVRLSEGHRPAAGDVEGGACAPQISVIVASLTADGLAKTGTTFVDACDGVSAEVLVVRPGEGTGRTRALGQAVTAIRVPVGAARRVLVPELWAAGLWESRGRAVAFSTDRFAPGRGWARALLAALEGGATGAAGPIELDRGTGILDWAVYLQRYSGFMPPAPAGPVAEIPGENAAYRRSALEAHSECLEEGFWEVEFHRLVHAEGGRLVFAAAAGTRFMGSEPLPTLLEHRFLHGRRFGRYRVAVGGQRWRGVLATPAVPLVLVARILRRAWDRRGLRLRSILAIPVLALLGAAWAAGEGWGAWTAGRRAAESGRDKERVGDVA